MTQRIKSPCVGICDGFREENCSGCGRTQYEKENWSALTLKQQTTIARRLLSEGYLQAEQINRMKEAFE